MLVASGAEEGEVYGGWWGEEGEGGGEGDAGLGVHVGVGEGAGDFFAGVLGEGDVQDGGLAAEFEGVEGEGCGAGGGAAEDWEGVSGVERLGERCSRRGDVQGGGLSG